MKSQLKYGILLSVVFIVALSIGLSGGVILDRRLAANTVPQVSNPSDTNPNFDLITQAWNLIKNNYVDHSADTNSALTYGAISGMVSALGDTGHSRFLTPSELKQENAFTAGQFEGIGAEVEQKDGNVVIVYPLDGSPAQKAGLLPGDVIMKVDGVDMAGQQLSDVVSHILGPAGTKVTLTILRPSTGTTIDFTITRAEITVQNVTWQQIPGTTIADLRIDSFASGVTKDLQNALNQIKQQHVTGIILDLRNNPGGLLDESVSTASQFLGSGVVLEEKDATGQIHKVSVQPGGIATQIPLVVLINQGTASAAEIVAGALQDNHRAQLVGDITFGTGTILNQFSLSDGSAMLLATQEWLTPDGHTIWHTGITPDVKVTIATDVIPLIPETMHSMTAAQIQASSDQQLLQAIKALNLQLQKQTSDVSARITP
jgi:carboxyl-terminal processing protease